MASGWAYEKDGILYPRVTKILSILNDPELDKWRERIGDLAAEKISLKASKRGTAAHRMISEQLSGKKVKLTAKGSEAREAYETWSEWFDAQVDFRPSRIEWPGFHGDGQSEDSYSGTIDCIEDPVISGIGRVTDWKVAGRMSEKHWIQLSGYVPICWPNWQSMATMPTLRVVRIDPVCRMFTEESRPADPRVIETFFHLLTVYRRWFFDPAIEAKSREQECLVE